MVTFGWPAPLPSQPRASTAHLDVLGRRSNRVMVGSKGGCGNGREAGRGRQGDPESTGVDPREWAQPHGAGGSDQSVPHGGDQFASARQPRRIAFTTDVTQARTWVTSSSVLS